MVACMNIYMFTVGDKLCRLPARRKRQYGERDHTETNVRFKKIKKTFTNSGTDQSGWSFP